MRAETLFDAGQVASLMEDLYDKFLAGKDSPLKREIPPVLGGFFSLDRKRKALRAAGIPARAAKDQSIISPVS